MKIPVVAIVGRPNVGKSSFFNIIAGERVSIVDPTPGATRDRIMQLVEWQNRRFFLIDTGGIEPQSEEEMARHMRLQAELALEMADVVLFMTDVKEGLTPGDEEIAQLLRQIDGQVVVAVNKCDHVGAPPPEVYEFYELGFAALESLSTAHRLGLGEVMDRVLQLLPPDVVGEEDEDRIGIAVIGRPNAGKSSLVNRLLGETRSIVTDVAGTTRDAIDAPLDTADGRYLLIDTAGLQKRSRVAAGIEKYAMLRALAAIERAQVCLLLIDGQIGITAQDTRVAGLAHEAGKASIFLVNKWDAVDKEETSAERLREDIRRRFPFMDYAPILFVSARTGSRVGRILPLVNEVAAAATRELTTAVLNSWLADAVTLHPTPQDKGRPLKMYYVTQVATGPPTFLFFVNDPDLMHFSYERYLMNRLRDNFDFAGTPVRFILRGRGEDRDAKGRGVGRSRRRNE